MTRPIRSGAPGDHEDSAPTPHPPAPNLLPADWSALLEAALAEDIGPGDVTSEIIFDAGARARARIEARERLVVCGTAIARAAFERVDADIRVEVLCGDGEIAEALAPVLRLEGPVRGILTAERTALNFLGRMCGVATHVRRHVEAVAGTGAAIVDTRKTLPGWRALDKYAVATGGGTNHRMGLYDGVLLKDNHAAAAGSLAAAVARALARVPEGIPVQVEVQSLEEARAACAAGATFLLLDNLAPDDVATIVAELGGRATLEASGGITLRNVRAYAETGVHRISLGALTHSAPNADLALEIDASDATSPGERA